MLAYRQNLAPILPPVRQPTPAAANQRRRVTIPDEITDPLAREILGVVRSHPESWLMIETDAGVGESTVRWWFYRKCFSPRFAMVQAVLAAIGWKLVLQRIDD